MPGAEQTQRDPQQVSWSAPGVQQCHPWHCLASTPCKMTNTTRPCRSVSTGGAASVSPALLGPWPGRPGDYAAGRAQPCRIPAPAVVACVSPALLGPSPVQAL